MLLSHDIQTNSKGFYLKTILISYLFRIRTELVQKCRYCCNCTLSNKQEIYLQHSFI